MAQRIRTQGAVKKFKTATGIKDTYFEHFLASMNKSYKQEAGPATKQAALSDFTATLPSHVFSPVWRIKGNFAH